MKHLRQVCAATLLLFMLAFSTLAGEMSYPIAPPPPQPQTAVGEMGHPVTVSDEAMSGDTTDVDLWSEVALTLMRGAFSVF